MISHHHAQKEGNTLTQIHGEGGNRPYPPEGSTYIAGCAVQYPQVGAGCGTRDLVALIAGRFAALPMRQNLWTPPSGAVGRCTGGTSYCICRHVTDRGKGVVCICCRIPVEKNNVFSYIDHTSRRAIATAGGTISLSEGCSQFLTCLFICDGSSKAAPCIAVVHHTIGSGALQSP